MPRRSNMPALLAFFAVICLASLVLVSLNAEYLVFEASRLPYGSRVIAHTFVPAEKAYPRVLFLGNSVFQYTPLDRDLRGGLR